MHSHAERGNERESQWADEFVLEDEFERLQVRLQVNIAMMMYA
jgi:hypothetical protein